MIRAALFLALALLLACGSPVEPREPLCYPSQPVPLRDSTGQPAPFVATLSYCPR